MRFHGAPRWRGPPGMMPPGMMAPGMMMPMVAMAAPANDGVKKEMMEAMAGQMSDFMTTFMSRMDSMQEAQAKIAAENEKLREGIGALGDGGGGGGRRKKKGEGD